MSGVDLFGDVSTEEGRMKKTSRASGPSDALQHGDPREVPNEQAPGGCTVECWTAVPCPTCGNPLGPRGRSMPMEMSLSSCCEEARMNVSNPRHLWDIHDSTRHYTDPYGWMLHQSECERCQ